MVVKKFYGATSREALARVRVALGADALILSNRQTAEGEIEITAAPSEEEAAVNADREPFVVSDKGQQAAERVVADGRLASMYLPIDEEGQAPPLSLNPELSMAPTDPFPAVIRRSRPPIAGEERFVISYSGLTDSQPLPPTPASLEETDYIAPEVKAELGLATVASPALTEALPVVSADSGAILQAVSELRSLVETQMSRAAWSDLTHHQPERVEILRQLLTAGFSPALARELFEGLPKGISIEQAQMWIRNALLRNLPLPTNQEDRVDRGGIIALVGPTGVGKTTTVAKLAARYALKYGAEKVALISTDSYRIGAHDQLRIYGSILEVPVYSVKDEQALQTTLEDLADRAFVLVDTVGMSQRDQRLVTQTMMLGQSGLRVERVLLLSATTQAATIDDIVRRYRGPATHNAGLTACILTKVDEALSLGASLDALIRHQLVLYYVTNGQRVPEDLHLANGYYLVDRAFKTEEDGALFGLKADECSLMASAPLLAQPRTSAATGAQVLRKNRRGPSDG